MPEAASQDPPMQTVSNGSDEGVQEAFALLEFDEVIDFNQPMQFHVYGFNVGI